MINRIVNYSESNSFFLFGPRGTGKSTWTQHEFPNSLTLDFLKGALLSELISNPTRLEAMIDAKPSEWVILDEVQKVPAILDEVHRLIENKKQKFILTGSSSRKLKRGGANLLAGRARLSQMHPLTAEELGPLFDIKRSLKNGQLPSVYFGTDSDDYLKSYIGTYLKEEVKEEALVRNLNSFARFLEAASFSQGNVLSIKQVASDCGIARTTVESYFELLEDLLLSVRLPVFQRRAKRKMTAHPKFYFFDCGVYRAIRPKGPLDPIEELDGPAIETLLMQELRASNSNNGFEYKMFFWRTSDKAEVDFILYGERGLLAFEIKRSSNFRESDLKALKLFVEDYPMCQPYFIYLGEQSYKFGKIRVISMKDLLMNLSSVLRAGGEGLKKIG